ncbi:MAG TPA: DUF4236 domain-containing protein [Gallionella sp.]
MRFLFRKRIKLLPGISLNLSRREASTTFVKAPDAMWSAIVSRLGWVLLLLAVLGGISLLALQPFEKSL